MVKPDSDLEAQFTKRQGLDDDLVVKADGDIDVVETGFDKPMEQALPTEMIRIILDILVAKEQSRALATAAQCNRRMYDYIIPKLYKTIRVTEENRDKLFDGCTPSWWSSETELSRKDIAMRYCRKLVLDSRLTSDLARFYEDHQAVEEVAVTSQCLLEDEWRIDCPRLYQALSKLAPAGKDAAPLHVTCHVPEGKTYRDISQLQRHGPDLPSDLITYEVFDHPISRKDRYSLDKAYLLRAVVHFVHPTTVSQDETASLISRQLLHCFQTEIRALDPNRGQLYLCDIPQLVLSPDELPIAVNVEETALLKLYNSLNKTRPYPVTSWNTFQSKIKLVKSGFKPSMSDLIEGRRLFASNTSTA